MVVSVDLPDATGKNFVVEKGVILVLKHISKLTVEHFQKFNHIFLCIKEFIICNYS